MCAVVVVAMMLVVAAVKPLLKVGLKYVVALLLVGGSDERVVCRQV